MLKDPEMISVTPLESVSVRITLPETAVTSVLLVTTTSLPARIANVTFKDPSTALATKKENVLVTMDTLVTSATNAFPTITCSMAFAKVKKCIQMYLRFI